MAQKTAIWLALGAGALYLLTRPGASVAATPPSSAPAAPRIVQDNAMSTTGLQIARGMSGADFASAVRGLSDTQRDAAALLAAQAGATPAGVADWKPVPVSAGALSGTIYVAPDFWGVGNDADWVRWPVMPATAQRIAELYGAVLPTQKVADAIQATADVKVRMAAAATNRDAVSTYVATNARIVASIARRTGIVDGHKKNILTADSSAPGRIVIYGALNPDTGRWPLQPYSTVHSAGYRDYSHGVRLVRATMDVAGRGVMDIRDVMQDRGLAPLVSGRATDRGTRY